VGAEAHCADRHAHAPRGGAPRRFKPGLIWYSGGCCSTEPVLQILNLWKRGLHCCNRAGHGFRHYCWGNPLSAGDTGPCPNRGRVASNHVTPPRGVACDAPLGRVSMEALGHTRNDPSAGARGDEYPIEPETAEGDTRHLDPRPLEGPGRLWKLPQSE